MKSPSATRWLIAASVMLATFMEVLDTTIANVSLPHVAGNLSATTEEATWVLTSYLVSNAIILPMSAWLGRLFGRKRFLLGCVSIFTLASCLCGFAPTLGWLIAARVLQGVGGGALQPIAQAVLLESFPLRERGMAMGIFSLGVVVAPIIGPTLGGWITDNYTWRWIFFINLPIGLLSLLMIRKYIQDPPHASRQRGEPVDYWGLGLLVLWLSAGQIVLDKGQQLDWWSSPWIVFGAVLSVLSFIALIYREVRTPYPIVAVRVLRNRNLAIGTVLVTICGAILYASMAILPIFLQSLMGYSALLAGMSLSPRGIGAFFTSTVIGRIVGKVDPRWLMTLGFTLLATTNWWLSQINLSAAYPNFAWPLLLNGIAISCTFVPMMTTTMSTLRTEQIGSATGIYNLMRNLGGSIGIAVLVTFYERWTQMHQAALVTHLSQWNPVYQQKLNAWQHALAPLVGDFTSHKMAQGMIMKDLLRQARMLSFLDGFRTMALLALLCIPLVWLFKRPPRMSAATELPLEH